MTATLHVRLLSPEGPQGNASFLADEPETLSKNRQAAALRRAVVRTREWLLSQQHADGYWVGELEGDTILESEYILLLAFLGKLGDPRIRPAAHYLLKHQLPNGGG